MPKNSVYCSDAMGEVVAVALARGRGELEKWRGGYWTYPGCEVVSHLGTIAVPAWCCPPIVVHRLVANGFAHYVDTEGNRSPEVEKRIRLNARKRQPGRWI